jgi:hypothetical protein
MPILVTCPTCQVRASAPETSAGKRAKCRKCGGIIQVPASATGDAAVALAAAVLNSTAIIQKRCANCDREPGKLERLFPWDGNEVCLACYEHLKLEAEVTLRERQMAEAAQADAEQQRLTKDSAEVALAKAKTNIKLHFVGWPVLALAGFISSNWALHSQDLGEQFPWFLFGGFAAVGIGGIGVLLAMKRFQQRKCPKCKRPWAALFMGRQDLGSHEHVQLKTEKVHVREGTGLGGRVLANFDVPVQEKFMKTAWNDMFQCKFCGHDWAVRRNASRRTG